MKQSLRFGAALCFVLINFGAAQASISGEQKDELYLYMKAAVDRDCDGALEDESSEDRTFTTRKSLSPGQCVIYRTQYRNEGTFGIRHLRVTNEMPGPMIFILGSDEHIQTPPGLWPEATVTPDESDDGSLIWRFGGALAPGEEGALQFRARLLPP